MPEENDPIHLDKRIQVISQTITKLRNDLISTRENLPIIINENMALLEKELSRFGHQVKSLEEERSKMLALTNISQVINSSLELDEVLRIVMDTIIHLTNAERCYLMLRDEQGVMTTRIARNWEQESVNPSEYAISQTVIRRVIEKGQPVLSTNAQEDPRFRGQDSIVAYNVRSILCVPLMGKSILSGVIYADNRVQSGIFSIRERDLLIAFANQAAIAIENARLFTSLRHSLANVTELKNLMDNVFSSIASGVITVDMKDKITFCNPVAEVILGHTAVELVGQQLDEVVPSLAKDLLPHIAKVRQSDQPIVDLEVTHTLPDRGRLEWRLNLSPLKDADQTTQGIAIVLDDLTERKHLEAQRRLLERMVSPSVLAQLEPDSQQLSGKRVDITTIFADIRDFTGFSEKLSPEDLVAILNRYLAAAAEAILEQGGTIDKFLGDAIMAWFNAPIPQPDHTLHAVRAALVIQEATHRLHAELPAEAHLSFGVGIHYGEAVLGLIGTEKRIEYTAIGDSVNTAKRIQENAAPNQILISKDAYERVKQQVKARPDTPLMVKGKRDPIEVYEILGLK
jgi:PAS domain S-box-containing protein